MTENKNKLTPGQAARAKLEEYGYDYPGEWNRVWEEIAQAAIDAMDALDHNEILYRMENDRMREENKRLNERVASLEAVVRDYELQTQGERT